MFSVTTLRYRRTACIVDNVAWSITWLRTDVGIVVTSVVDAIENGKKMKKLSNRKRFPCLHSLI